MDLMLEWGQDLVLTPNGSLATVDGWSQVRERIIRRFLTNPAQTLPDGSTTAADYIFHTDFGLGAGALVSQNPTATFMADVVKRLTAAVLADPSLPPGSAPQVTATQPAPNTFEIFVTVPLGNGQQGQFSMVSS